MIYYFRLQLNILRTHPLKMPGASAWDRIGAQPLRRKPKTDIFTSKDCTIDRRHSTRQVPLEVLALGLGRTGTDC